MNSIYVKLALDIFYERKHYICNAFYSYDELALRSKFKELFAPSTDECIKYDVDEGHSGYFGTCLQKESRHERTIALLLMEEMRKTGDL